MLKIRNGNDSPHRHRLEQSLEDRPPHQSHPPRALQQLVRVEIDPLMMETREVHLNKAKIVIFSLDMAPMTLTLGASLVLSRANLLMLFELPG